MAEPATAALMNSFAGRDLQYQNLRDSWGYVEVGSDAEIGFANWEFADHNPQADLLEISKRIALAIERDSYIVESINLATKFPPIWLEPSEDKSHAPLLEKALGGASVSSTFEKGRHPDPDSQHLIVFVVELDSPESAKHLLELSKRNEIRGYSRIGFSSGRVFALLVARSVMAWIESSENKETLERFRDPIQLALQQTGP